jgi:hypothetical protein
MRLLHSVFLLVAPALAAGSILSPPSFGPTTNTASKESSETLRWSESNIGKRAPEESMESLIVANQRATLAPRKDSRRAFNVKLVREDLSGTQYKKYKDEGLENLDKSYYYWEFYETTTGTNARCGENLQNRSNQTAAYILQSNHEADTVNGCKAPSEGIAPSSVIGAWPRGTYKIEFDGNKNCEYKNDGHSYGALYCDNKLEMSCKFEAAVLTNPDPRGKDGVWQYCDTYMKELIGPIASDPGWRKPEERAVYQLPFILCEY